MIKTLTIELALCQTNTRTGIPLPRRKSWSTSKKEPLPDKRRYDVIVLRNELPKAKCPEYYQDSFFETLNISEDHKELMRWVAWYLAEYLSTEQFTAKSYEITDSYAHFAFTDEEEKTIFAAPHITSPVLFDPNDQESNYKLVRYRGSAFVKRTNPDIVTFEEIRRNDYERRSMLKRATEEYKKPVNIINSLLNFSENLGSFHQANFKSVYEEKNERVFLPSVFSISTYELRSFISNDPETLAY